MASINKHLIGSIFKRISFESAYVKMKKASKRDIDEEDVHFKIDNSASTGPRGFPEFDKLQLDATRREQVAKLRVKMIDFNEIYLAKHPQVEALLRLIVMEVLCHKPYDVRGFIKNLLLQDNLETRVAKIILSKRINLERSHTEEYFEHIGDWETKCNEDEGLIEPPPDWPEPRPYRQETRRDKKEYCHLNYYTEPFFLYPSELMKYKDQEKVKKRPKLEKMPRWKSTFLLKDFMWKWGDPFDSGVNEDEDDCVNEAVETDKRERNEGNSRSIGRESESDSFTKVSINRNGVSEETSNTSVVLEGEGNSRRKDSLKNNQRTQSAEYSDINRSLLKKCKTCRKAVLGLHKSTDAVEVVRISQEKEKSGVKPPHRGSKSSTKSVQGSPKSVPTIYDKISELERNWMNSKKSQVYTRTEGGERYLYNDKFERLAKVKTILKKRGASGTTKYGSEVISYMTNWTLKDFPLDDIEYTVPVKELQKRPAPCYKGGDGLWRMIRNDRHAESAPLPSIKTDLKGRTLTPELMCQLSARKGKPVKIWALPPKYKEPKYQVIIIPSPAEAPVTRMKPVKRVPRAPVIDSRNQFVRYASVPRFIGDVTVENPYGSVIQINDKNLPDVTLNNFFVPVYDLQGNLVRNNQITVIAGPEITDTEDPLRDLHIQICAKKRHKGEEDEISISAWSTIKLVGDISFEDNKETDEVELMNHIKVPIVNLDGEVINIVSVAFSGIRLTDKNISGYSLKENKEFMVPVLNLEGEVIKTVTVSVYDEEINDETSPAFEDKQKRARTVTIPITNIDGSIYAQSKSGDSEDKEHIGVPIINLEGQVLKQLRISLSAEKIHDRSTTGFHVSGVSKEKKNASLTDRESYSHSKLSGRRSSEKDDDGSKKEKVVNLRLNIESDVTEKPVQVSSILKRGRKSDEEYKDFNNDVTIETGPISYQDARAHGLLSSSASQDTESWVGSSTEST